MKRNDIAQSDNIHRNSNKPALRSEIFLQFDSSNLTSAAAGGISNLPFGEVTEWPKVTVC